MVAKLAACQAALKGGAKSVRDRRRPRAGAAGEGARRREKTSATTKVDELQTMSNVTALEAQHVLQTYKRQPVVFVRGEGARLFDENGRATSTSSRASASCVLGHAHPGLAAVIADQAKTLIHTSNLYYHPLQGQLAAQLAAMSGLQRAFFCNSGTEAVEACLKFARRYWYSKGDQEPRRSTSRSSTASRAASMGAVGDRATRTTASRSSR